MTNAKSYAGEWDTKESGKLFVVWTCDEDREREQEWKQEGRRNRREMAQNKKRDMQTQMEKVREKG